MSSLMLAPRHHWRDTREMRTTVRLDADVAAAAEQLSRERHIGLGEAINQLARAGMRARPTRTAFWPRRSIYYWRMRTGDRRREHPAVRGRQQQSAA